MSLQFIMNTASHQGTKDLLEEAANWLDKDSSHQVFYLVPNHVKFETEINVLEELYQLPSYKDRDTVASMRLQVFSFTRLSWYFLQHTASYQKEHVSEIGKFMILRQVLLDIEQQLQLFRHELNRVGFIEQLVSLFDELEEGHVLTEDFGLTLEHLTQDGQNKEVKLNELYYIYNAYQKKLTGLHAETHDTLVELSEYLMTQDLSNVMVILTGFSHFTAVERQLIDTLLEQAGEVRVHLILDKPYVHERPVSNDLFFATGTLYHDLYHAARQRQVPILMDRKLVSSCETEMRTLDDFWQHTQTIGPKKEYHVTGQPLSILECADPYDELQQIAKRVRQLVASGQYRYQDILLLTRDMDTYQGMIAPVFAQHDIPIYVNQETEMTHHPLVEFMTTLFRMNDYYYQYQDVIRFFRTELIYPLISEDELTQEEWYKSNLAWRTAVDYTENVVLAYGYSGNDWLRKEDWSYVQYQYSEEGEGIDKERQIQESSNQVRTLVRERLRPFYQRLSKAQTGKEAITLFYQLLLELGVDQQLLRLRDQALIDGNLTLARNHEQAWQTLMDLLDEYYQLLGEESFDKETFQHVLMSGMEGASYSKVPTSLDQLTLSPLDMVRTTKAKIVFIFGATDQCLPKKIENDSLLTNEERSLLSAYLPADKYLSPDLMANVAKEPFMFYLALLSAQDRVILSYPRSHDLVKDVKPSSYVTILLNGLKLKKEITTLMPSLDLKSADLSTDESLLSDLIRLKRWLRDERKEIPWLWQRMEDRLLKQLPLKTTRLLQSLSHKNIPERLTEDSLDKLYGETIHASVSKIENFYSCQYKYFLTYGLGLKEREQFELSPAATGDFYHETLDAFFQTLIKNQWKMTEMTAVDIQQLTEQVLEQILGENKFAILSKSNRMNYIKYQLKKTIHRVSWALQEQSKRSRMTPLQTELLFGEALQQVGVDSLTIELEKKKKIKVRGKIDRIDQMILEDDVYLSVIDYKSSKHNFDFVDAYYGLAMQMITYLNVALSNAVKLVGKEAKPAGAFYMHVQHPVLPDDGNMTPERAEHELLKAFRLNGVLTKDANVLEALDRTMDDGVKSDVYPYEKLKKGTLKSSQFVSTEDLETLISYNEHQFKKAGESIFQGETKLNPSYKGKERLACGFCPFRSVCQFDAMLPENKYHRIEPHSQETIMEKIREELEEDGPR